MFTVEFPSSWRDGSPAECLSLLQREVALPPPNTEFSEIELGQRAKDVLRFIPSDGVEVDSRQSNPGNVLVRFLFDSLVDRADDAVYVERAGLFLVWISPFVPSVAAATRAFHSMEHRWRDGGARKLEDVLAMAPTSPQPSMNGDEQRLFVLGKALIRLGQMRATHQFAHILELVHAVEAIGVRHPMLTGYYWFASLGGGSEPLSPSTVRQAHRAMVDPRLRESSTARFLILNGLFLAPPSDDLRQAENGEAIEVALSGHLHEVLDGLPWDGKSLVPRDLSSIRTPWGERIPVAGYFYARAFRLQCRYLEAYEAIDYAFAGLGGGPLDEMLMGQFEREREAIRLAAELQTIASDALRSKDAVEESAERLRVENAQLIATFTGFFAFIFGALALFFREQDSVLKNRQPMDVFLINVAILLPAGLVMGGLILLSRAVFSRRRGASRGR